MVLVAIVVLCRTHCNRHVRSRVPRPELVLGHAYFAREGVVEAE